MLLCGDKCRRGGGSAHDGGDGSKAAADHFGRWGVDGVVEAMKRNELRVGSGISIRCLRQISL